MASRSVLPKLKLLNSSFRHLRPAAIHTANPQPNFTGESDNTISPKSRTPQEPKTRGYTAAATATAPAPGPAPVPTSVIEEDEPPLSPRQLTASILDTYSIAVDTEANCAGDSDPKPTTTEEQTLINLNDCKELFSSVPTKKLIKSTLTLEMASIDRMVDVGSWVMKSRLMQNPISKRMVLESIERTFYDHFCGGKDLQEAGKTVRRLCDYGLKAMLDYGMEHALDNESCDKNVDVFIQTIDSTASIPTSPVSFVVVKITAICTPDLLKRASDLLRWEYNDKSMNLPWKLQTLPIFSDSSAFYHTPNKPEPLTQEEERDLDLAHQRLIKICEKSLAANRPVLIDAEDTTIQPAIDYFTYLAAIKYHRGDTPLIFNTIQAYLKDAKERLVLAKKAADEIGVPIGIKLVRGAYMSSERRTASSLDVESPIHDTIENTHACFNACAAFMLEEIAKGSGSLVLATHNLESGKLAADKAMELGMKKDNENLHFAQLYGMAEALSFALRNAGFTVSKYLPFGRVEQIMPYLLRRAEENRGLLSTSSLDRQLMRKELLRRVVQT